MSQISISNLELSFLTEETKAETIIGGGNGRGNGRGNGGGGFGGGGFGGGGFGGGGFYESDRGPGNSRSRTFYAPGNGGGYNY